MNKTISIGVIGFGNMGSAIAKRIKKDYKVIVFDKDQNKTAGIKGIYVSDSTIDLVKDSDVLLLAVKPQDFDSLLFEIQDYVKNKLVISIAAGIRTSYIEKVLKNSRVVRVMPNLPATIGRGISILCKGKSANNSDLLLSKIIFKKIGKILVYDEIMMKTATATSGSGPGFFCDYIERNKIDYRHIPDNLKKQFEDSFVNSLLDYRRLKEKWSRRSAMLMASATTSGTLALLKKSDLSPKELKEKVASRGGTTESGLAVLNKGGTLKQAIKAARKRAKGLEK